MVKGIGDALKGEKKGLKGDGEELKGNGVLERDVAQWLERGALPMSLPAVRFRIQLGAGFSEKYHVSPLSILGYYFNVVFLGKTLYPHMLHLTQV